MKQKHPLPKSVDFIPVATVCVSIDEFASKAGLKLEEGQDELDAFKMAYLAIDGCEFLIVHHGRDPKDFFDIWLPTYVEDYRACLKDIIDDLPVPPSQVMAREVDDGAFGRRRAAN